jgi:putative cell wall-binding protein
MRSSSFKKSLAATAVLASSVVTGVGLAGSAQATSAGPSNSPLTITNGTGTILFNGQARDYQGSIGQAAWAPDGSRIAFIDTAGNIFTERAGGSTPTLIAPAKAGAVRSNPTWIDGGKAIVFSEKANGVSKLQSVPSYTAPGTPVTEADPLSFLGSHMTEGTESAPDSNGKTLAFQHHNAVTNQDEIWVQDDFGRGSAGPILLTDNGATPTVSPDGKTIAFVRTTGGHQEIWTAAWNGQSAQTPAGPAKQITTDTRDHFFPTYSPDGSRIAYEGRTATSGSPDDVDSIAADGSGARQESNKAGFPAYQPLNANTVVRLSGSDRIGTAVAASQAQWKAGNANSVVISRSDQFADALGGSALATSEGGPLLLTPSDHLDATVKAEITRALGPAKAGKTVFVLGGEQALSPAVFNAVKALGYNVQRLAGPDRYATSVAIAKQITSFDVQNGWGQPGRVLVATGNLSPDALSAGAAAESGEGNGPKGGVVVLTNDKQMPASTAAYLAQVKTHNIQNAATPVYGIGGQADAALTSIGYQHTSLVGSDRYETSYLVAKTFFGGWDQGQGSTPATVGFATGLTWADALSGGAFMGQKEGPLLLVNPATGEPANDAEQWLVNRAPSINTAYIFGGPAAVPSGVDSGVGMLIGQMGGAVNYQANPKA